MLLYLLLDTNILLRLVSHEIYSPYLRKLEYWVKQHHVVLLAPKELRDEWIKHRSDPDKRIEGSLDDLSKAAKTSRIFEDQSSGYFDNKLSEKRRELFSQIKTIDELLSESAIHIEADAQTHIRVHRQRQAGKKPFWNTKKDHTNDALLIFSTLDFLKSESINVLYFVSVNTGEFATGEEGNWSLHQDIVEIQPDIKIHYYTHFRELAEKFERLNIPGPDDTWQQKTDDSTYTYYINRDQSVLNQMHEYLEKRFAEINVLPAHLFLNHFPFLLDSKSYFYKRPFILSTDNESVYNLLTKVQIIDGSLKAGHEYIKDSEDEAKFKTIIRFLRLNQIYRVAIKDGNASDFVYNEKESRCSCSLCLFHGMNWVTLIDKAFEKGDDYNQSKLLHAFGQFKSGNLIGAIDTLEGLREEMEEQRNITYYIICFNLQKLGYLLRNVYYDDSKVLEKAKSLISIELRKIFDEASLPKNEAILSYIHAKKFISDTTSKINEKVNEIVDQFYGRNTGYNSHTERLIEIYSSFLSFIDRNFIIYPFFEVDAIANLYTHGLFASYGSHNLLSGKLRTFSNNLIQQLVFYGNAELIRKLSFRYKIYEADYDADSYPSFSSIYISLAIQINQYQALKETISSRNSIDARYFWDNYAKVFFNSLTLLAVLKTETTKLHDISAQIVSHLEIDSHLHDFHLAGHLTFFLRRKHKYLTPELLKSFLLFVLRYSSHSSDDYLEVLQEAFEDKKLKVYLSVEEFEMMKLRYLTDSEDKKVNRSWHSIGLIFELLEDEEQKNEIAKYVIVSLTKSFKPGNFYISAMFEIITDYSPFLQKYINEVGDFVKDGRMPRLFERKDFYTDSGVDNFLNFCFKYELEVPAQIADNISALDDYYTWLLDLDGFDYNKFNSEWIHNHFTLYYKRRFRKSKVLKEKLLSIIREDINSDLERRFISIFCDDK